MGLSSITIEIILILAFQTFHGYIYLGLALLFSFFMLGLCLGAFSGTRRNNPRLSDLLFIQFVFMIFIFLLLIALQQQIPLFLFFVFLLLFGAACGHLFVISNRLFLQKSSNYGLGYGLDLLGSFLGALAVSSVLIPLVGLQMLTKYLFLINSFTLLFLAWGTLKPIGSRQ
jgi:spermidine synthase